MMDGLVTEIPSYLKQLARLVARAFYQIEDSLIIDMLVRNTCMKEKDMEDLLKFDLKLLRSRMATLKNEKFVQLRLKMETGIDGKAQKVNYYFINYKSLVNVIKYKLDHMRKRMETQESDATNRASFKCSNCMKSFTDLEAGELFDPMTGEFFCTFCKQQVEEDEMAVPKKDSRLMLAKFNDQLQHIFELLRKAEDIKLAPELLEPELPKGPNTIDGNSGRPDRMGGTWSGEATRSGGLFDESRVDIKIGDQIEKATEERKERPIWMVESTIGANSQIASSSNKKSTIEPFAFASSSAVDKNPSKEDLMSLLLTHEKKDGVVNKSVIPEDNSDDDESPDIQIVNNSSGLYSHTNGIPMDVDISVEQMDSDEDGEQQVPLVCIGSERIPLTEMNEKIASKMTDSEREAYVQQFQDFYAHIYY